MDIAIVGYHGKFPKANTLNQYWKNLSAGDICTEEVPVSRWNHADYFLNHGHDLSVDGKWGGFLDDVEKFDALLFRISPKEAREMDPQERLLLESVWTALELSGYGAHRSDPKQNIGIFVGIGTMSDDYSLCAHESGYLNQKYHGPGTLRFSIANRISFALNLLGPSMCIDTACSSSLVAIHVACRSMLSGDCDMAVVGGVNLVLHPFKYIHQFREGLLSSTPDRKLFEPGAEGYIPGEGVGSLVLKPLKKAVADKDCIHGVIKGTATNHSGGGLFYKLPNPAAQARSFSQALNTAGIDPLTLGYIEMSSYGAEMVDKAEFSALMRTFGSRTAPKKPWCALGSVKPNIGHLEAAAGVSQMIKVLQQFHHKMLLPSRFSDPTASILKIENSPFYLQRQLEPWHRLEIAEKGKTRKPPRRAAVCGFGAGGVNAHVVLEEYIPPGNYGKPTSASSEDLVFVLSAENESILKTYAGDIRDFLGDKEKNGSVNLTDLVFTFQRGREAMKARLALPVRSMQMLEDKLSDYLSEEKLREGICEGTVPTGKTETIPPDKVKKIPIDEMAARWVQGQPIDWEIAGQAKNGRRQPFPTYPFDRGTYWLDFPIQSDGQKEDIEQTPPGHNDIHHPSKRKRVIEYLKTLLSEEIQLAAHTIDETEEITRYGLDSMMIKKLNARLEQDIGALPKTIFFEFRSVADLAAYLIESHGPALNRLPRFNTGKEEKRTTGPESGRRSGGARRTAPLYTRGRPLGTDRDVLDIAVIGISGRYPMADTLDAFWDNLSAGRDCISEIPKTRWNADEWYDPDKNNTRKSQSKWGGFLSDIDRFDPLFFEISPAEAEMMDPQERLFLQTAWEVLEDAGYTPERLHHVSRNGRVGVFAGVMWAHYQLHGVEESLKGNAMAPGSFFWSVPNRVSYCFNFQGPSLAVDTACSSSLTAIHLACDSMQKGECDAAIAGGVCLAEHPMKYLALSNRGMASSDGKCRAFGNGGDGYVPGEGVGAVLLKPLHAALKDDDRILGVIKTCHINHGGRSTGYSVPSLKAQAAVVDRALTHAKIHPETIGYIEAHGTGTSLGDPIEFEALSRVFRKYSGKKRFCPIGSVKSNIGHLESAAGIAALTKVILQLKHRKLLPSLHAEIKNKNIDFESSPFFVQEELTDWERSRDGQKIAFPLRAGISSFGAGGSNAHLIVEEYVDKTPRETNGSDLPALFLLSAKNRERLKAYAEKMATYLRCHADVSIQDVAYTLQLGRVQMNERLAVVASTLAELISALDQFINGGPDIPDLYLGNNTDKKQATELLVGGNEGREFIRLVVENRQMSRLAQLWVYGVAIDWNLIHGDKKCRRISLPTYPFERKRYWIPRMDDGDWTADDPVDPMDSMDSVETATPPAQMVPPGEALATAFQKDLAKYAAEILKLSPADVHLDAHINEFGFDSITFTKLTERINAHFDLALDVTTLYEHTSIRSISHYISETFPDRLRKRYDPAPIPQPGPPPPARKIRRGNPGVFARGDKATRLSEPIAIIGMNATMPQSEDLDAFWKHLEAGTDLVSEIPEDRWNWEDVYGDTNSMQTKVKWGGFIDRVDTFDPMFFGIAPREAELMDPQQRLFLETVWKTIEDSGHKPSELRGSKTGVFVGVGATDYGDLYKKQIISGAYASTGVFHSILANRISYLLDLRGPSMPVDTACSSSLVAIHQAILAIRAGSCDLAIAGGVNLLISPALYLAFNNANMLAPDGKCKTFDAGANGYVRGEGVGAVLLKPLSQARADGDHIHALIKGSAVNHGGQVSSLTTPNPRAQADLVIAACEQGRVDPATITFIEAHGTGTSLGDPIEINGLKMAFQELFKRNNMENPPKGYCGLGAVKTNIGHLETAAGIAGMFKVILAMKNRKLPGNVHFETLNPHIHIEDSPFYVVAETTPWAALRDDQGNDLPRRAGVSSFGVGGANSHVVLEESRVEPPLTAPDASAPRLIVLSAKNKERLKAYGAKLAAYLAEHAAGAELILGDMAYTLQVGRDSMPERLALVAASPGRIIDALNLYSRGQTDIEDLFTGNVKKNNGYSHLLVEDEEGKEFVRRVMQNGKLPRIAQLWVSGVEIDWNLLYGDERPRRIPLPTYPFARERHWVRDPVTFRDTMAARGGDSGPTSPHKAAPGLHPLVHRNCSTLEAQIFATTFTGEEFYLTDHVAAGMKVLPGAAYIEMARAAGELSAPGAVRKIAEVVWIQPITVADQEHTAHILLRPGAGTDAVSFEVETHLGDGQKRRHAQGKILFEESCTQTARRDSIDLEAIRSRCPRHKSGSECYGLFETLGLNYGPCFQVIQEVNYNDSEVLAVLRLSDRVRPDDPYRLHPTLLDGAFQSGIALLDPRELMQGNPFLPFSLEEIEILKPIPPTCHVHVARAGISSQSDHLIKKYNIRVFDEKGADVIRIRNFSVRAFVGPETLPRQRPLKREQPGETRYYVTAWEKSDIQTPDPEAPSDIILFDHTEALYRAISGGAQRVILVKPGKAYQHDGQYLFRIRPDRMDDYNRLVADLQQQNIVPGRMIHLWSSRNAPGDARDLAAQLERGLYSVFFLTKALSEAKPTHRITLLYGFEREEESPNPLATAFAGFARALRFENRLFDYRTIDLPEEIPPAQLADLLLREFVSGDAGRGEVRYEGGSRYVGINRELPQQPQHPAPVSLKENGVYLITGGGGGLGFVFADYLVKKWNANLVLVGRSDLTPEKQARLHHLESSGSTILYLKADISAQNDVKQVVSQAKSRFQRINGVLHMAGVIKDAYVRKKSIQEMAAVLAPKVNGTLHLDRNLNTEPLDFFVLFSSTAAEIGNGGQTDYCFANRFLSAFADHRNRLAQKGKRNGKTIAVSWPLWRDGGMQVDAQSEKLMAETFGMTPLEAGDGIQAFLDVLANPVSHMIVLSGDHTKLQTWLGMKAKPAKAGSTRKAVSNAVTTEQPDELIRKIQHDLADLVGNILKIDTGQIDSDENLSEYGFDSISTTEFVNRINETYNLDLTPALFFEYPTILEFANHLVETYPETFAGESIGADEQPSETMEISMDASMEEPPVSSHATQFNPIRFLKGKTDSILPVEPPAPVAAEPVPVSENIPVAIIGAAGVFPQCRDLDQLWRHLEQRDDLITEVPPERWDWKAFFGDPLTEPNKTHAKWGGFIDDIDAFDAPFFGISRREAEYMDPQQRLFLEVVWKAVEDAGIRISDLSGTNTGLYAGVASFDYNQLLHQYAHDIEAHAATGMSHCILANRISYLLDLNGPSVPIDTACSSSLVSLHQAVLAIRTHRCRVAIAGGVNTLISPYFHISFSKAGMLSPTGRCKTFDHQADGYVRGEGAAAVVLKSLAEAEKDGDHIYAVIRGSAENHGGHATSLTAPNPNAQAELLVSVYEKTGVDPATITYIEAHGTGTPLGDPVEINGLKKAFKTLYDTYGNPMPETPVCGIGSIKTNMGHLETAAGIASVIKVLLAFKHKKIPGNVHFRKMNPHIRLADSPFYIATDTKAWDRVTDRSGHAVPRRAGVSSFGFGGSNAHVFLEEYTPPESNPSGSGPYLFVLSARTQERLSAYAKILSAYLAEHIDALSPRDVAYTLQCGREPMEERLCLVASGLDAFIKALNQWSDPLSGGREKIDHFHVGNSRRDNTHILPLVEGEAGKAFLQIILEKRELEKIAGLWVSGTEIEWRLLYGDQRPGKISLPTYPFARERYWIPTDSPMEPEEPDFIEMEAERPEVKDKDHIRLEIQNKVLGLAAAILKVDKHHLDMEANLGGFGFDSINLKDLSNRLETLFHIEFPPSLFFTKSSIKEVSAYLCEAFEKEMMDHTTGGQGKKKAGQSVKKRPSPVPAYRPTVRIGPMKPTRKDIAVIGISGMFPQSMNLAEYWRHLESGTDMVTEVPADRWDWQTFHGDPFAEKDKTHSKWGGFIPEVDKFDPRFFSMSPLEASMMDPQHRLFLEQAWKAIEDAGYRASGFSGKSVGVFVGIQFNDYMQLLEAGEQVNAHVATGNDHTMVANRISFLFNLRGPSESIDTACSSSLVAVHRAVASIRGGESELAVAGGVALMLTPKNLIKASQIGIISPDGRCKTFDRNANGYVKGEGVGAILLKPLEKAVADRDHIYAVIKGTAENHGGRANSLTAPNSEAQKALLVDAYTDAGIDPDTVSYIETHGTGTELGDPTEINGLRDAFQHMDKESARTRYCGLGALKTQIGHLEPASGIAGILKIILSMKHRTLPGILHLNEVNPYIKLEDTPFYIIEKTQAWEQPVDKNQKPVPRRAGVSAFGYGGTNCHVVLEEYGGRVSPPENAETSHKNPVNRLFVISAGNKERLNASIRNMAAVLENSEHRLADITFTFQVGREAMRERLALIVRTTKELHDRFTSHEALLRNGSDADVFAGTVKKGTSGDSTATPEQVDQWLQRGDLPKLARAWVGGASVDWALLPENRDCRRVSLPTYPFARERHWVNTPAGLPGPAEGTVRLDRPHPLIDTNVSTLKEQKFMSSLSGKEYFLTDHVVSGRKVLPGVAYLEIARAAGVLAAETTVGKIRNVVWASPVVVSNDPVQIKIGLSPNGNTVDYEVSTEINGGPKTIHSQGKLVVADSSSPIPDQPVNVDAIKERCRERIGKTEFYRLYSRTGIDYGPCFQAVQEVRVNGTEALARIELPDAIADFAEHTAPDEALHPLRMLLHPSLMDAGFQSILGLGKNAVTSKAPYLPFAMKEVEILRPLTKRGYAYITEKTGETSDRADKTVRKFNVHMLDENGLELVRMTEFSVRELKPGAQPSTTLYFQGIWKESEPETLGPWK